MIHKPKEEEAVRQYIAEIKVAREATVESQGKAIFYSGGGITRNRLTKNHVRALEYAKKTDARLIDTTEAGKKLDGVYDRNNTRFDNEAHSMMLSRHVMKIASKRYAQQARGDIKTFVCGASPQSVFRKTELPALLVNQNVRSVNGISRQAIQEAYSKSPNRAYRLVSLGELRQSARSARQEAKRTGDTTLLKDVRERKDLYKREFNKKKRPPLSAPTLGKELTKQATPSKTQTRVIKITPETKLTRQRQRKKGRGRLGS